ncbi:MAG: hypothetical protein V9G15_06625 [Dermatophilaceae bacterium]|nr:hypothetical protein [Actinomycetales bacterium]
MIADEFTLQRTSNEVLLWTTKRLPFEPDGWLRIERGVNLQTAIKTVVDGLISAFHTCEPNASDTVEAWLDSGSHADPALIEILRDTHWNVLGERVLVRPHGMQRIDGKRGIAWNPADDRCVDVTVRMLNGEPSPTAYSLSATLSERP